jgi:hypothetical protein
VGTFDCGIWIADCGFVLATGFCLVAGFLVDFVTVGMARGWVEGFGLFEEEGEGFFVPDDELIEVFAAFAGLGGLVGASVAAVTGGGAFAVAFEVALFVGSEVAL